MNFRAKREDVEGTVSSVDIMNVKTLIETAFGSIEENRVNFKLIQTILFLLARQLRILDRRVAFEGPFAKTMENFSSLEVTEVKVHAMQAKTKKGGKKGADKPSIGKPKLDKFTLGKIKDIAKTRGKLENYQKVLEDFIDKREKELRVINQRADSYEEPETTPKPMTSIDTMDAQYEKLLVVERVSGSSSGISRSTPRLSVVTQEEFMKLARTVRSLQAHFGPIGTAGFPENAQLMESLRQNASLTDAMAALQLSARLEAVEKILGRMTQLVSTLIGVTPGITIDSETRVFLGDHAATDLPTLSQIQAATEPLEDTTVLMAATEAEYPEKSGEHESDAESEEGEFVTRKRLSIAIKRLYDEVMREVRDVIACHTSSANQALKLASNLDNKLTASLKVGPKMASLESAVNAYTEQINAIDTGLSSQMSNYQEQLTQMQHELEIGLDAMAEAMANTGGDTVAMGELNTNFATLQMDFESLVFRQKRVSDGLDAVKANTTGLWKQIEMLRETKSDRDEVADALRDKAGIKDLNGLVPLEQFDAVRGDFEMRIEAAYNKFNNQELIWQKAIDEILRDLSEKGDIVQLDSLKDGMLKHLDALSARMEAISAIVGEPKTAIVTKRLFRDSACICCSSPAVMDMEKPPTVPVLPKFPDGKRAEDSEHKKKISGDGDTRPCYYGLPILHPIDPRAHYCQRYCGGSHTLIPSGPPKVPPSFIITPVRKDDITELGTDGKMYKVDEKCYEPGSKQRTQDPPPPPSPLNKDGT